MQTQPQQVQPQDNTEPPKRDDLADYADLIDVAAVSKLRDAPVGREQGYGASAARQNVYPPGHSYADAYEIDSDAGFNSEDGYDAPPNLNHVDEAPVGGVGAYADPVQAHVNHYLGKNRKGSASSDEEVHLNLPGNGDGRPGSRAAGGGAGGSYSSGSARKLSYRPPPKIEKIDVLKAEDVYKTLQAARNMGRN